jgi:PPOX class probable F420-dependent enzyme
VAVSIPDDLRHVLDQRVVAHVATVGKDGWPHVTAMWIARNGNHLLLNTAEGRVKWHNMRRDPRVGISLCPPDDSFNYSIKGQVVEIRTIDGDTVIDALARKYTGADRFPRPTGQIRLTILVEPLHIARGP